MDVGFLGLGQMGAAIAERLEGDDVRLHVFDPNPVAVAPFVLRGAVDEPSAAAVAQSRADRVRLPAHRRGQRAGGGGGGRIAHAAHLRRDVHHRQRAMARIAQSLAGRDIALVDCPISGGPKGARAGTLSVIAAGPRAALDEIRPLLARIGKNVFEVGERPGQAQLMKLVNNLISAANMATAFEALVLGAKGGLDPELMVNVINVSTGRNSATLDKVPRAVLPGTFDYGAKVSTMVKDIVLGLKEAEALGVPMWVHETVGQLWRFGRHAGVGRGGHHSAYPGDGRLGGNRSAQQRPRSATSSPCQPRSARNAPAPCRDRRSVRPTPCHDPPSACVLQIDPAIGRPRPHQIEPMEQRHAGHRRHLLHHALIWIEVGVGAQEAAELRIDQHEIAARIAHAFGAGVQHVEHAVRLQPAHRLHRAGLPQHQLVVLLLQRRLYQRQHVFGRHAAAAAHGKAEFHRW